MHTYTWMNGLATGKLEHGHQPTYTTTTQILTAASKMVTQISVASSDSLSSTSLPSTS